MAFTDDYELANDEVFKQKVQMAMVKSGLAVVSEDPGTAYHEKRATYANQVLKNPSGSAADMAYGVSSNVAITGASSDADIEFTVNANWNAYAGVVTTS